MQGIEMPAAHGRIAGRSAGRSKSGPGGARWLAIAVALATALLAGSAGAVGLDLSPGAVSNGIHDGGAAVTIKIIDADLVSGYADFSVRAAFIDTSQPFDLTLTFDAPVVQSVKPRLLGSPNGGSITWSNPSETPIASPVLSLTCSESAGDNECRYRFRLGLTAAPFTGEIAGVPVSYALAPAVPALPLLGRLALGALLLGLGLRART